MHCVLVVLVVLLVQGTKVVAQDFGTFWQLTDIHYDVNYSSKAVAPSLCRSTEGLRNSSTHDAGGGPFGDYNCDSPWSLVTSAIQSMKDIEPNPDFILWTGDSVPHVPDTYIDMPKVLSLMKNVTDLLHHTFPGTPIFPTIGNHDVWPAHQIPGATNAYYSQVLQFANFDQLLGESARKSFKQGGYYTANVWKGLRLISVNSNLWYNSNHIFDNSTTTDPANQLSWLDVQLADARHDEEKVLLMGHIPPGTMGRSDGISWLKPTYNRRFLSLLRRYSDVIIAAIFGHEHTDGFRVVYNNGMPVMSMFMAPALTPWYSSLPGIGSNNPGIRLYNYTRNGGELRVTDYSQYFVNLTAANVEQRAVFTKEYQATALFAKPDLSPAALDAVIKQFKCDSSFFKRYYTINSVSQDTSGNCSGDCRVRQICAAAEIDYAAFNRCVKASVREVPCENDAGVTTRASGLVNAGSTVDPDSGHRHHHSVERFTYFIMGGLLTFIGVLFLLLAICCCHRRHAIMLFSRSKYILIQDNPVG